MPSGLKIGEVHNAARDQADRNGRQAHVVDLGGWDQRRGYNYNAGQTLVEPVPSQGWNWSRLVEKAKIMADQEIATVPERPWSELTKAEKLGDVTNVALDIAREILALGVDPSDPKILQIVKDTALSVISNQIRVDTAVLAASVSSPAGLTEEQRRERARQAIREAFAERSQPCNSTLDGDAGS